jgi:hypothetical protein
MLSQERKCRGGLMQFVVVRALRVQMDHREDAK